MAKIINQELMRATNKGQILRFIRHHAAPVSKKEIADQLGFSTTSVATFINELIQEGKIIEGGIAPSTGGRKSMLYRFNPEALYVIGIDLQVDQLIGVLLNFNGERMASRTMTLPDQDEWRVAGLIDQMVQEFCAAEGILPEKLAGVGVAVPGTVRRETSLIEFAPNLGWRNVNLRQLLAFPQGLLVENEANAGAFAEKTYGAGRFAESLIYISIGIGVGTGLILSQNLYTGFSEQAGEFGHMTVESEGLPCGCGGRGCWEAYTSNVAVLKRYTRLSGKALNSFEEFLNLLAQGDSVAEEVRQFLTKYLAIGIANMVNGFNPERVIIGGEIAKAKQLLYADLWKQCKERCLERSFLGLEIVFSELGEKVSALGVAGMMLEQVT